MFCRCLSNAAQCGFHKVNSRQSQMQFCKLNAEAQCNSRLQPNLKLPRCSCNEHKYTIYKQHTSPHLFLTWIATSSFKYCLNLCVKSFNNLLGRALSSMLALLFGLLLSKINSKTGLHCKRYFSGDFDLPPVRQYPTSDLKM